MAKHFDTTYLDNHLICSNGTYMEYRQKEANRTRRLKSKNLIICLCRGKE